MKESGKRFKDQYVKQLESKEKFYDENDDFKKKDKNSKDQDNELKKLDDNVIDDIKYGAENIRIALKEKYLGRELGKKRGETMVVYSNDLLTIAMSSCMIVILLYISRQVTVKAKNKLG